MSLNQVYIRTRTTGGDFTIRIKDQTSLKSPAIMVRQNAPGQTRANDLHLQKIKMINRSLDDHLPSSSVEAAAIFY